MCIATHRFPGRAIRLSDPIGSYRKTQTIRQLPIGSCRKLLDSLVQDSNWKLSDAGSDGFRQSDPAISDDFQQSETVGKYWIRWDPARFLPVNQILPEAWMVHSSAAYFIILIFRFLVEMNLKKEKKLLIEKILTVRLPWSNRSKTKKKTYLIK